MTEQGDDKKTDSPDERLLQQNLPEWKVFDAPWYLRRYEPVLSEEEKQADSAALEVLWRQGARQSERSPNRFFDEKWYLDDNKDIGSKIRSGSIFETGFQHYEEVGFKTCSPHWLFREEDYFRRNPDLSYRDILSLGFLNGYDHYLKKGDKEGRQASLYFQPALFISEAARKGFEIEESHGAFRTFLALKTPHLNRVRTSWYFDPDWYLSRYPEVEEALQAGDYAAPLEHYLCNHDPLRFDPNPYFSEVYYLAQYPDIEKAIAEGHYRNGYEHFLATGLYEGRRPHPSVEIDLGVMKTDRAHLLIDHNVSDPFAFYIRQKEEKFPSDDLTCTDEQARKLAVTRLEAHLPALYRHPLVFEKGVRPEISVILFSQGDYLSVTATLLSLHQHGFAGQEIIIVSRGNLREKTRLEKTFRNMVILTPSEWMTDHALFLSGVKRAHCEKILLVYAGVTFRHNAFSVILSCLGRNDIVGGGGQVLSASQKLLETGIHILRDGSLKIYGVGEKAFAPPVSFPSVVDAFKRGAFFTRKKEIAPLLETLSPLAENTGFLLLTASLSGMGKKLLYCPRLVMTDLETGRAFDLPSLVPEFISNHFPAYLSQAPLPIGQSTPFLSNQEAGRTVLLIYQHLPLRAEEGFSRRAFDLLELFVEEGWTVTLLALKEGREDRLTPLESYPPSVRWLVGEDYLQDFLLKGRAAFDLVWMNGSEIAARVLPLVKGTLSSSQDLVLDVTTLEGEGLHATESALRRRVGGQNDPALFLKEVQQELSDHWLCRAIITDNEEEAASLRKAGIFNVVVIPNRKRSLNFTPHMTNRTGLFFPLPIYKAGDAAHDAFDWFCLEVAPLLKEILSEEIPLWVGGYHHHEVNLGFYERFTPVKGLREAFSFEEKMSECRLAVIPTRFMTTITPEILDVTGAGLPAVMSSPIIKALGFKAGQEGMEAGFNDPQAFAMAVAELYTDEKLWTALSQEAYGKISRLYDSEHFRKHVRDFLEQLKKPVFQKTALKLDISAPRRRFQPAPVIFSDPSPDDDADEHDVKTDQTLNSGDEEEMSDSKPGIRLGVTLET